MGYEIEVLAVSSKVWEVRLTVGLQKRISIKFFDTKTKANEFKKRLSKIMEMK